jgi:mono/diheme cytochrome c family protein
MINRSILKNSVTLTFLAAMLLLLTGCDLVPLHMRVQPRFEPLDPSTLWADGASARPIPANTIPRGQWGQVLLNDEFYTGKTAAGEYLMAVPLEVNRQLLHRGQEQFNVFCAPCHGKAGYSDGLIVQRGFKKPPSYHDDRLRQAADGYFYEVMSIGFGTMYSYASRISPEDRWAIVAYIRALQLSQNVSLDELPADVQKEVESQLN